jgi:hypothetical protein
MHPTLQPYVDPPTLRVRNIAAGALTGLIAILITLGVVRYAEHERHAADASCGGGPRVISAGPDHVLGTADDIRNDR